MISLRPRQEKAINDIRAAYKAGRKAPLLRAATGFGKTAVSIFMIQQAIAKGQRVWFLAHLKEILNDTAGRLHSAGIPYGDIRAGFDANRMANIQIVSVQTAARRLDRLERPTLIIVDECHLAIAQTYQDVFEWAQAGPKFYQPGGAKLLLLTATPTRLDGRGLGEVADTIVETCSTQDLIDEGLLAPIRYYAPQGPDLSSARTVAGDYNQADVAGIMDKPSITGNAVAEYRKVAHGRPAVAFCVNIKHAESVAAEFRAAGYRALAVSGESDTVERDAALRGLRDGQLDVVCNCALWVAGVDAPSIACIIMLAPTQSLTKYLQSIGRGLRTHIGKDCCIILDHAGNLARHGDPTQARTWSLNASGKQKAESGSSPVKVCPACFATVYAGATDCSCGHHFEPKERELREVEGDLSEVILGAKQGETYVAAPTIAFKTENELLRVFKARGTRRPELRARAAYKAQYAALARQHGIAGAEKLAREFNAQP